MPDPITPLEEGAPAKSNIAVTSAGEMREVESAKDNRKEVLNNAFMLGWLIIELKSRIQIALVHHHESGIIQSSVWRSIVNKIAVMQVTAFPKCSTAKTLYEPPSADALPYLYHPEPDYANVGIPENDSSGQPIMKDFKLYDVTRRAINCLTLLYVKEQESLVPDLVKKDQKKLVSEILAAAENTGKGGGDTDPAGDIAGPPAVVVEKTIDASEWEKDLATAIDVLTKRVVKFLDAWDGYLRENYYAGGVIPQNESELVAYEAGRAMSLIPWSISVMTVPLIEQKGENGEDLSKKFVDAWQMVFRPQVVVRLEHQISSLSSVLDDCYRIKKNIPEKKDDDQLLVVPDAKLPSQAIMAVKQSLNYWQRTVQWVSTATADQLRDPGVTGIPGWSEPMRLALIEQANIWQTLITGQQSLSAFNMESITKKLMEEVTENIQQSLHKDFKGSFKKAEEAMSEIAGEVKDAVVSVSKTAVNGLEEMYNSLKKFIWPVVGAILLIFIALLIMGPRFGGMKEITEGVGLSGIISAVLGYLGLGKLQGIKKKNEGVIQSESDKAKTTVDEKTSQTKASSSTEPDEGFLGRLQGAAKETGKMVLDAFDRGYKQIRIELSGMSRSAAVSYPLIEFFGTTFKLENDDDFLTEIIWSGTTRTEQLKRVMSAAFGPIAIFITPMALDDKPGKEGK